jgi:hypothetical protein
MRAVAGRARGATTALARTQQGATGQGDVER